MPIIEDVTDTIGKGNGNFATLMQYLKQQDQKFEKTKSQVGSGGVIIFLIFFIWGIVEVYNNDLGSNRNIIGWVLLGFSFLICLFTKVKKQTHNITIQI